MSSSLCGCCRREPQGINSREGVKTEEHIKLSVKETEEENRGQTMLRLRGQIAGMRQQRENEKEAQRKTVTATSKRHQTRMGAMNTGHDAEMARMQQSNNKNTAACDRAMATMKANAQQRIKQNRAEHTANVTAVRRASDGVKVKHNERVNVLKLANAQRVTNLKQRLDAQCADLKQRQQTSEAA